MARVTRHVKTQIHTLVLPSEERTNTGPAKSMPVYINAGSSLTLNYGNGGGGGLGYGWGSFMLPANLYRTPLVKLQARTIQNLLLNNMLSEHSYLKYWLINVSRNLCSFCLVLPYLATGEHPNSPITSNEVWYQSSETNGVREWQAEKRVIKFRRALGGNVVAFFSPIESCIEF